jgi:hypothetical protein
MAIQAIHAHNSCVTDPDNIVLLEYSSGDINKLALIGQ